MLEKRKAIHRYHAFNARVANDGPHTRIGLVPQQRRNIAGLHIALPIACPRRCCLRSIVAVIESRSRARACKRGQRPGILAAA